MKYQHVLQDIVPQLGAQAKQQADRQLKAKQITVRRRRRRRDSQHEAPEAKEAPRGHQPRRQSTCEWQAC